jgi:hypothetical protein
MDLVAEVQIVAFLLHGHHDVVQLVRRNVEVSGHTVDNHKALEPAPFLALKLLFNA